MKLRQILEERLVSLKARYEKEISKTGNVNSNTDNQELRSNGKDTKRKTDHQLLIEVWKNKHTSSNTYK